MAAHAEAFLTTPFPKPLPPATAGHGSGYVAQAGPTPVDPVLALRGVGRELWADEEADAYVSRLREGWS